MGVGGVALRASLPRRVLLGRDELGAEFVQLAVRCFQLLINQPDADAQRADMGGWPPRPPRVRPTTASV